MAERFKATDLKSVVCKSTRGSNPFSSSNICKVYLGIVIIKIATRSQCFTNVFDFIKAKESVYVENEVL